MNRKPYWIFKRYLLFDRFDLVVLVGYVSNEKLLVCLDMLLNTHPCHLNKKRKSLCLCKYHRISIFIFFSCLNSINIIAAFKKIFSVRHSHNIYLYEPVFLAGVVNVTFGKRNWIKIWNLWGISRRDDAGVKMYNDKFENLIYTSTDMIQQII